MRRLAFPFDLQRRVVFLFIPVLCAVLCLAPVSTRADDPGPLLKNVSRDEIVRMGEVMYLTGILPSGEPMQAIVQGDIPVSGSMFTCVSCHLRSGFGTGEGLVRTPPIDGARLYSPISLVRGIPLLSRPTQTGGEELYRPAYTDETLARAIETGTDPTGRRLNTVMPIYFQSDRDRKILVYYLKNLSTGPQPGVTESSLRFATVITEDVPKDEQEAMLGPLRTFINNWRLTKTMERGIKSFSFRQEGSMRDLRTNVLSVWELKGTPETWREQLEEHYRKDPVFALLGGIATGEWAPIHRFCEDHRVPSIFPITDLPVISETDWYTVYLSRGLYQEGETAARYLHTGDDQSKALSIVQVFRNDAAGLALSKAFAETWVGLGHTSPDSVMLQRNEAPPVSLWKKIVGTHKHAVVLVWLNADDFPDLGLLAKEHTHPSMVFASSSLLGQRLYALPESERGYVYLTYPRALPQESLGYRTPAATAMGGAKALAARPDTELKMSSLFQTISNPLSRMRSFVYRDYFLELIEATPDLVAKPAYYPRLSFGPGQRYSSKGCYIVQLSSGPTPTLIPRSEWVIH